MTTKTYNGLPLYRVTLGEGEQIGMDAISLVDDPAVGDMFLKFADEKKLIRFSADEEKHIITGVALSCNLPIYRIIDDEECYVVFDKDTIEKLVVDYSKKNLFNSVNLQHDDERFVNGVYMIESYFVDRDRGIAPKEFPNVENGSYIVTYKVTNDELWNEIKESGDLNGFSIQGWFDLEPVKDEQNESEPDEFDELFKSLFSVQERDVRRYIDDRKQLDITVDGKTFRGQIYGVGKTDGERTCIIQNNDKLTWYNYRLEDIEKMVQTDEEIAMWNRNDKSYSTIMEDPEITTSKVISAPTNEIEYALQNNLPVMISYYDGENSDGRGFRQCVIGAYGYTRRGNECIRVYQYYGASHSEPAGQGIWRLLLCKRIVNMQIIPNMEPVYEEPPLFNPYGDDGMATVIMNAEFLY